MVDLKIAFSLHKVSARSYHHSIQTSDFPYLNVQQVLAHGF